MTKLRALACALATVAALCAGPVSANGWEHGAIPFEALVKALDVGQTETRARAAVSLGIRGQAEGVPVLLGHLERGEPSPQVRSALYEALGRLGDIAAVPPLAGCLAAEARDELRAECARALGAIGHPTGLPALLEALAPDQPLLVRSAAVDGLAGYVAPPAIAALQDLVWAPGNRSLRRRAIRALGLTGASDATPTLLHALQEAEGAGERAEIVVALGRIGGAEALAPLVELLPRTSEPGLRARIAVALGAIRTGGALEPLVALLEDPARAVRYYAIEALHELGDVRAALPIARLSLDMSRRHAAADDAELLADAATVAADLSLQVTALRALTALDPETGLEALLAAARARGLPRGSARALQLADAFYRRHRTALYGLGYSGSAAGLERLLGVDGTAHPDPRIRAVAVRSLGVLGIAGTEQPILAALDDPEAEVRWTTAAVLGRLGVAEAIAPLIERLRDQVAEVRRQAALSLGYLGAAGAREALVLLAADDPSPGVREAAGSAVALLR